MKYLQKTSIVTIASLFVLLFPSRSVFSYQKKSSLGNPSDSELQYSQIFEMAEKYRLDGEFENAIRLFEKSLNAAKKISDEEKECESLIKLGLLYWNIGNVKESTDMYDQALSLAQNLNLKNKQEECQSILEIYRLYSEGRNYWSSGEYQKSIKSLQKSIDLAVKIGSKEHEGRCLRRLSVTYWELNNLKKYFSLNEKALKLAQSLNHRKEEGRCLYNMGCYYDIVDNYSKALNCYEIALTIPQYLKDKKRQSACLNNIGIVYEKIGDYDKSLDYLMKALNIDEELGYDVHIELNNIGESLRKKGLISGNKEVLYKALDYLKDSLELTRKAGDKETEVYVLNNMGGVYTDLEKYYDALKCFQEGHKKAEEIQNIKMEGMILNNIGIVYYNQANYEESTKYFQRAIDLALEIEGKQILWEAYLEIAKAYEIQGLLNKALENYKESIKTTENIRSQIKLEEFKAKYLGTNKRIEAYHNLIHLLVNLHNSNPGKGYDLEAFNYIERAKARAFLDSLELSQIDISQSVDPELINREKELMKDITDIYNKLLAAETPQEDKKDIEDQLHKKEAELEKLKREMRIKNPAYANVKYPEIITLDEARKKLPDEKTAFFEYSIGEENSYALAITKKDFKIFPLPPKNEIQELVKEYHEAISDKDNQHFHLGYDLFSKLVLPGLDNNIKNIIFIPDDILHFLPFETLVTHKEKKDWLIKGYRISYMPSISSLREILQNKEANGVRPRMDLLALGDPYFGSWETNNNGNDFIKDFYRNDTFQFFRLEFSGLEIDRISSLFKKIKRNIFRREKATERELKKHNLSDYKIIHFATHSLIDDRVPARSSIVLSLDDDSTEDGFLQMREIYNLKLNSDLIILSSCQTGGGRFLKGEGIEGLNRAFFYAGSSSVIMTLWAVSDQASCQLMERFYSHLRSSESIQNALRKAKLEMIESDILSHPYYWAGFIVTGNANKIIFPNTTKKWLLLGFFLLLAGGIILLSVRKISSYRVSHD